MLASICLAGLVTVMSLNQVLGTSYRQTLQQLNVARRAEKAAQAGFHEALGWFRQQDAQPVGNVLDPNAAFNPLVSRGETLDESIGLLREAPVGLQHSDLWIRYEVRRNGADPERSARDITNLRTARTAGQGIVWSIGATGIVFRRRDPSAAFDQSPNEVLSRSRVLGEIRRLSIFLPASSAVIVRDRSRVRLDRRVRLTSADGPGLSYYSGASGPTINGDGQIVGGLHTDPLTNPGGLTSHLIFEAEPSMLSQMADVSLADVAAPALQNDGMNFTFTKGDVTFGADNPLRGSGLLIVDGDLTADRFSTTFYTGLIYVAGNASFSGATRVTGALVVEGELTLDGGSDIVEILYDANVLATVRQTVGQYRISQVPRVILAKENE